MKHKRLFFVMGGLVVLVLATLACGSAVATPQAQPTATPGVQPTATLRAYVPPPVSGPKYGISEISSGALDHANQIISSRMMTNAWTVGIAIAVLTIAIGIWFAPGEAFVIVILAALIFGLGGGDVFFASKIPATVDGVGHKLADKAITDGVSIAQKAQATNYQYIHANIVQMGTDVLTCQRTVNHRDACGVNAPQYEQYEEINIWYSTDCTTDSDGHESCTTTKHSDDEWTPWFDQVVRYYVIPDTKARYLSEAIYHQGCLADDGSVGSCTHDESGLLNDSRKPVIYLQTDWRAPADINAHLYRGGTYMPSIGNYNNHIPDTWAAVQASKTAGGPVYEATFIGPYFNWGFAADSPLFEPYTGHYQDLLNIASLPLADGATFTISDGFGKPFELHTQLTSTDGDLPVLFNPVTVVGSCVDPSKLAPYKDAAMELQGDFGPHKQGSLRWFLVCDSIVTKLGGMPNVLTALKAYERDVNVWGLVSMPQNLVIVVTSVSDDGTRITGRGMETGMPAGNVLVKQDMMASISDGSSIPLTPENMIGSFTANYVPTGENAFKYQYSDLSQAGGATGILYQQDPNYTPPDPSDPNCQLPKADHHGFIRYSMCNSLYLKTNIQVNQDGYNMIMNTVSDGAQKATPVTGGWVFLVVAVIAACFSLYSKFNDDGNSY